MPSYSDSSRSTSEDLFDLLTRLQGYRLDDQRCTMPRVGSSHHSLSSYRLESVLRRPPPYPMVVLPQDGGYWCDPVNQGRINISDECAEVPALIMEPDDQPLHAYRTHFHQAEHFNFCGEDAVLGPVVVSVKYYSKTRHIRVLLRLSTGSTHQLYQVYSSTDQYTILNITKLYLNILYYTILYYIR